MSFSGRCHATLSSPRKTVNQNYTAVYQKKDKVKKLTKNGYFFLLLEFKFYGVLCSNSSKTRLAEGKALAQ